MKKIVCLLLAALLLVGCAPAKKQEPVTVSGTMEELINKMFEKHRQIQMPMMTMAVELTDTDSLSFNMGLDNADQISDAAISEPMMGQPMSLVLVRVKDAADAEPLAKQMLEKINTAKWICMEADTKTAAYYGDVVMFFMIGSQFAESATTDSMLEAFAVACGGDVKVVG